MNRDNPYEKIAEKLKLQDKNPVVNIKRGRIFMCGFRQSKEEFDEQFRKLRETLEDVKV